MKKLLLNVIIAAFVLVFVFSIPGCDSNSTDKQNSISVTKGNSSVTVNGGTRGLNKIPVAVEWDEPIPVCMKSNGVMSPVQEEKTEDGRTLLWLLAEVSAGESRKYVPGQKSNCESSTFKWEKAGSDRSRLLIDGQPAIEYVYPVFDVRSAQETMRPFHHVYSPDGSQLITKGAGGRYPHHRGIFYGYRNIHYNGKEVSTWANSGEDLDNLESTQHVRLIREWNGPVFGGHQVAIEWRDEDGKVFADEVRIVRVIRRNDREMLIDVESILSSGVGSVELGGDLQHAGLQFRAAQYVADHPENSRYLRPEKWSEYPADEELNDTDKRLDDPWNAFLYVVEGVPYTVGYFSHPQNPPGGQMSERLYGRFGEFIPGIVIDEGEPLHLRYRLLIASGHGIDRKRMEKEYSAYTVSP